MLRIKWLEELKLIAVLLVLSLLTGWVSGYDDNDWPIEESLSKRVTKLEKEVEKL